MKRMLAAHSEPIYQICKAFRSGEVGANHNPEFTLLEWYQPGFNHHDLMDEVALLIEQTLGRQSARRMTYSEIFREHLDLDPHSASSEQLQTCGRKHDLRPPEGLNRDDWLDLLLSHLIAPHLGKDRPLFVYDYPASQAALARVRCGDPPVAERFELWVDGIELANGFHELTDATEQRRRFVDEADLRRTLGKTVPPIDERLLAALEAGLPACSGVALGIDRLLRIRLGVRGLDEVLGFPWSRS